MKNNFHEGQKIVCVSENFPLIKEYGGNWIEPNKKPKKDEVLIIDEILGDFLRFDKYDTSESFNWWKYDRFADINELEELQNYEDNQRLADEIVNDFENW